MRVYFAIILFFTLFLSNCSDRYTRRMYNNEGLANTDKEIFKYVQERNLKRFKIFSDKLDIRDDLGKSLLHIACQFGAFDIVKYLVSEKNSNVNETDYFSNTPLHEVCYNSTKIYTEDYVSILKFLLDSGANIDTINKFLETPRERKSKSV